MSTVKEDLVEHSKAIYETAQEELQNFIQFIRETWPLLVLLLCFIGVALWFAKPAPPRTVWMASGSKGGSYEVIATQYVKYFEKHGVKLILEETLGAEQNIERLSDPKDRMQAAFIQGGLATAANSKNILALGSIAFEPLWFFYRNDRFDFTTVNTADFIKQPMAIGAPGSGTHHQAIHILKLNGLSVTDNIKELPNDEGVQAFIDGKVSSIIIVDGFESANVQRLLSLTNVSIGNFERAEAYTRLMPYFHKIMIPEGALNLEKRLPVTNISMIAPTTNLIIDKNMHPAIQLLFLQAAKKINGGRSFFADYGQFPAFMESTITESDVAKHFYENGSPALMNYLPFWLAEFLDRMLILLLPLFAFAYPVIKTMPSYRLNRARSRINEVYGSLKFFEENLSINYEPAQHTTYVETLNVIDERARKLRVPKAFSADYYSLRTNIDFVRNTLTRMNLGRQGL